MKLTELRIGPAKSWDATSPLVARVKLASEDSTVECQLSDESMRKLLDLCAEEVAKNAERNVREFVSAVTAINADRPAVMLGS